jgi:hypothetical protein
MFPAYQEYLSLSQNQNCLVGLGGDVSKKCGVGGGQADGFCAANGSELCCTATQNVIAGTTTATSLPSPSQASSPDNLGNSSVGPSLSTSVLGVSATDSPTPQPNANTESANQGGVNPLFIAAGAIGVILVAILGAALFFMTKRVPKQPPSSVPQEKMEPIVAVEETMEVIFEYQSNLFDELTLGMV